GSDVGAGYERSMVRIARAAVEVEAALHPDEPPPNVGEAWRQITAGNAALAGWPDCGSLVAGAQADVLVVEPDLAWREHADPLAALLFAWDDRWLRATVAAGEVVYRAGS